MADKTIRGRFVWHELMTPDSPAAHAFYGKVLGWKTQPWEHDPAYAMFAAASGPLGGVVAQPEGNPAWIHYIGTPDLTASVHQATSLGASVTKGITSTGAGGSYAVLTDPQGATFAMYASDGQDAREKPAKRGEFSWHELATTDVPAALDFYGAVFGWEKIAEHDMGPIGFYYLFGRNGNPTGGMFKQPSDMPGGPAWLGYVRVKDANKAVKKAKSAGGTLLNGPMEVPGGDWIAQLADPQGAVFAVHVVKADVESTVEEAAAPAPAAPAPAAAPVRKKAASASKAAPARKASKKKRAAARKRPAAKKRRAVAKSLQRPARKAAKVRKAAPKKQRKRPAGKKVAKTRSSRKAVRKAVKTAGRKARKGK